MKISLLMAAALSAVVGLASCNGGDAKLAGNLVGTWTGQQVEMMNGDKGKHDRDERHKTDKGDRQREGDRGNASRDDDGEMTCTPTFTFVRTDGTNGGTINISADYTFTRGVDSMTITTPVKATVNGNLTASGTWTVIDDDEVIVYLDPSKTVVNVDTASLILSYARLTDAPLDSLDTIKGRVAGNIAEVLRPMLTGRIQKMRKFDDVKITGNTMTLEAGHSKMIFTKK